MRIMRKDSVQVDDMSKIPVEYQHPLEIPKPRADKNKIAEAIKAGKDVPGATLIQGEYVVFK